MNIGIFIVIAIAAIWAIGVFLGAVGGLSKSFSNTPSAMDSSSVKAKQQQFIEDTESNRKQAMESMKQKITDESRKY
jgi:hypothetical protein